MNTTRSILVLLSGSALAFFAGCNAAGSDFETPKAELGAAWQAELTAGLAADKADLKEWWKSFGDPVLDSLIERAAGGSLDVKEALARVRKATGLPVLTDVHTPDQCAPAASVVDVLQIPAFLCRQTDLLEAAGATGKPVNVKKGQWLQPEGMRGAVQKIRGDAKTNNRSRDIAVTERGTFFGYGDLVVDMRSFTRLREACDAPVIFDATHSVQRPGQGPEGASGGAREYVPVLALSAIAAGAQGLFLETHPDPDCAPSDGPNMIPLSEMENLLGRAVDIWARINQ